MKIVSVLLLMMSSTICVAQVVDSVKVVKPINDLLKPCEKVIVLYYISVFTMT